MLRYLWTASLGTRSARAFPEEAILHCRSGTSALKGNLPDQARKSFQEALRLDPMLWEALEGLCSLGMLFKPLFDPAHDRPMRPSPGDVPEIEDLFPSRPTPVKRPVVEEPPAFKLPPVPVATGVGFFTPDTGNTGNLFRGFRADQGNAQPFRLGPRDSL